MPAGLEALGDTRRRRARDPRPVVIAAPAICHTGFRPV